MQEFLVLQKHCFTRCFTLTFFVSSDNCGNKKRFFVISLLISLLHIIRFFQQSVSKILRHSDGNARSVDEFAGKRSNDLRTIEANRRQIRGSLQMSRIEGYYKYSPSQFQYTRTLDSALYSQLLWIFMNCKTPDITAKLWLLQPLLASIYYIKYVIAKLPMTLLNTGNTVQPVA